MQEDPSQKKCDDRSRSWTDSLEDEGATSQGMQVALAAGKGEEMDSLLVSRRNSALDFSSMRLILEF